LDVLEDGWSTLHVDFQRTIPVRHQASGLYDLTAGACVLGDVDRRTLHYCRLPQKPDDAVEWSHIPVGHQMVDFGLALHEHDLIAVLTLSPHAQHPDCCMVELRLLQFSTGNAHPLAQTPVLFVEASDWAHPAVLIEIVGDHLVLVMTHAFLHFQPLLSDRLYVYNWKTGTLKMAAYLPCQTYHGVIFLSPTVLCLPNKRMNTLDVWLIPDDSVVRPNSPLPPLKPFLYIGLPPLSRTHILLTSLCRAEPNPAPSGTPYSRQPSHPAPADAIAVFSVRGVHRATMHTDTFTLFVHRRSLLRLVRARHPDHSARAVAAHPLAHVPWDQWGAQSARMFAATPSALAWITTTAGQRCAVDLTRPWEDDDDDDEGSAAREQTVTVLDFNPGAVRRLCDADDPSVVVHLDESVIEHEMFEEPVKTCLPYVSRVLSLKNDSDVPFKGVLLDEERLLGIKVRNFVPCRTSVDGDVSSTTKI
ncbi:hypothetical protein C0993_003846, partial [Termitomyces sp. T159_Od127]